MNKEIISEKQMVSIIVMYLFGSSVIMGSSTEVGNDVWIVLLAAAIAFIPLMLVYVRIMKLFPQQSIFDIFEILFGRIAGKVFGALFTFYAIYLGALVSRNYSEFVQIVTLPETPQIPLMIALILVGIYLAKSGIEVIGRFSVISMFILLFLTSFTTILSINKMEFSNLLPVLNHHPSILAFNTLKFFSYPFAESVLILSLGGCIRKQDSPNKIFFYATALSSITFLVINLRNVLLLDIGFLHIVNFPTYKAVQLIELGDFLTRVEATISMNYILAGISKITVCIFAASLGLAKIFEIDESRKMILPASMMVLCLGPVVFKNMMEMFHAANDYPFIAFPFQVIIPLIIWITAEIKTKKEKKNRTADSLIVQPKKLTQE